MSECLQLFKAEFVISNKNGIHARPAAILVNLAKKFKSTITITNITGNNTSANAKNLLSIIACTIKCGNRVLLTAEGSDAEQAVSSIGEAISQGLGE